MKTVNYTLTVPRPGENINVLAKKTEKVRSSGPITSVKGPFRMPDYDYYMVETEDGHITKTILLTPGADRDPAAKRVYRLLAGVENGEISPGSAPVETAPGQGFFTRFFGLVVEKVKTHPVQAFGLALTLLGALLYFFGYTELGQELLKWGLQMLAGMGATTVRLLFALPSALLEMAWLIFAG